MISAFFHPFLASAPRCVEAITFHRKDGTNTTLGHSSRAEEEFVLHDGEQIVRVDGGTGIHYELIVHSLGWPFLVGHRLPRCGQAWTMKYDWISILGQ